MAPQLEPVPIFDGELPGEVDEVEGPLPADLRITELARYGSQDTARIVVFLNRPARYEVGKLAAGGGKGPRLFLDIDQAGRERARSRDAARAASLAAQQVARLAVHDGMPEAEAARRAALDRMTVRKLMGK